MSPKKDWARKSQIHKLQIRKSQKELVHKSRSATSAEGLQI